MLALLDKPGDVNRDRGIHEQAASIREPLDEIVSLGFLGLSHSQIEDLRCLKNTPTRRLLRGHDIAPQFDPVNHSC
ncbi:MAG: hypothetical protein LC721_00095 [Actinobacteria bacterium]|nr:hypothetical protein [Actinomycetota bacterium]